MESCKWFQASAAGEELPGQPSRHLRRSHGVPAPLTGRPPLQARRAPLLLTSSLRHTAGHPFQTPRLLPVPFFSSLSLNNRCKQNQTPPSVSPASTRIQNAMTSGRPPFTGLYALNLSFLLHSCLLGALGRGPCLVLIIETHSRAFLNRRAALPEMCWLPSTPPPRVLYPSHRDAGAPGQLQLVTVSSVVILFSCSIRSQVMQLSWSRRSGNSRWGIRLGHKMITRNKK